MSRAVVKRLIDHARFVECGPDDEPLALYEPGVHSETFTLVLQGAIDVQTGMPGLRPGRGGGQGE
jgi:hypothetical protein